MPLRITIVPSLSLALLPLLVSACSLVFETEVASDESQGAVDAAPAADALVDARQSVDSGPMPDAFACSPAQRLSIDILNPGDSGGDVLILLNGLLTTTCRSDDLSCYVCITPGTLVSLDPVPDPGSVFTSWNQCGPLCSGGATSDPCNFAMPGNNVGCLANFEEPE